MGSSVLAARRRAAAVNRRVPGIAAAAVVVTAVWLIYWLSARDMPWPPRRDFFYLADAFLHGRTWLEFQPDAFDVIVRDDVEFEPVGP